MWEMEEGCPVVCQMREKAGKGEAPRNGPLMLALAAGDAEKCALVVGSSWSTFIMSTGRVLLVCRLSCGVCAGVPSLDACVLRLLLHVLACHDIITS
jgi:hypothetical protein